MGLVGDILGSDETLEGQIRANPLDIDGDYSIAEAEYTSPQTVQQYLTLADLPFDMIEEPALNQDNYKLPLINETVALNESLHNQAETPQNPEELGQKIFQEVIDENAATNIESALEEDEQGRHQTQDRELYNVMLQNAVPRLEGGAAEPFRYTFQDGNWKPLEQINQDYVEGVEVIRKSDSARGGKKSSENPEKMWRLRETEFSRQEGEWKAPSWRQDPTLETQMTQNAAEEVVNKYQSEYPSVELTLFGSCSEGTMTPGSDLEHSLHINAEDIGLESNEDVHTVYHGARDAAGRIRDQILHEIGLEAEKRGVPGIEPGYGYVAIRDSETEYPLDRRSVPADDFRTIMTGEETKKEDYEQHLKQKGLTTAHPRDFYELPRRNDVSEEKVQDALQKLET